MAATQADRDAWKVATDAVTSIEMERAALLAAAYEMATSQLAEIEGRLGEPQCRCEGCGEPVFAGEPWLGGETPLCGQCAPTYAELLTSPESFVNGDDDHMSADEARAVYDAHIAAGGKPTDSMATP